MGITDEWITPNNADNIIQAMDATDIATGVSIGNDKLLANSGNSTHITYVLFNNKTEQDLILASEANMLKFLKGQAIAGVVTNNAITRKAIQDAIKTNLSLTGKDINIKGLYAVTVAV